MSWGGGEEKKRLSEATAEGLAAYLLILGVRGLAVLVAVVHVLGVGAGVGEALAALLALEGLLSGVQAPVLRQVVLVLEGLGAHLAGEGAGACNTGSNVMTQRFNPFAAMMSLQNDQQKCKL